VTYGQTQRRHAPACLVAIRGLATMCCCTCASSASHAARQRRGGLLAAAAGRDCGVHVAHAGLGQVGSRRQPSRVCKALASHPSRHGGAVMGAIGCAATYCGLCTAMWSAGCLTTSSQLLQLCGVTWLLFSIL
jgi:hypothetical protein